MTRPHSQPSLLQAGMALVTVLIFGVVAIVVITLGVTLMIIQTTSSRHFSAAQEALAVAESGMENGLIRLIRDPNYAGETLTLDNGTATIVVSGTSPNRVVTVRGEVLNSVRTLQVQFMDTNGVLEVESWQEVY